MPKPPKLSCDDCKHLSDEVPKGFSGRDFKTCKQILSQAYFARKPKDRACKHFERKEKEVD